MSGPRTRDGGEVVAEYDPLVGRNEVATVVQPFRRGGAGRVQAQHPHGDEGAVETISEGIDANRRGDEPEARYRFPAVQGDAAGGRRAEHRDAKPCEPREQAARRSGTVFRGAHTRLIVLVPLGSMVALGYPVPLDGDSAGRGARSSHGRSGPFSV